MDENKILKMYTLINKKEEPVKEKAPSFSLQTNPIIQRMLLCNMNNKKDKFKFKDLFR